MTRRKTHEEFVAEVKALVGDEYTVLGTYETSKIPIEIKHNICGCSYNTRPNNFLNGHRCHKCFGAVKKTTNEFKEELREIVGDEYVVLGEYKNNHTKVLIKHELCGTIYKVSPNNFLGGSRCLNCSAARRYETQRKSLKTFSLELRMLAGDEYIILGTYINARTKIKLHHVKCGHTYEVRPYSFLAGCRCPKCKGSKGERKIMNWLTANNIEFDTQFSIKYDSRKHPLKLDFYVHGVAIEYDGEQHFQSIETFGGNSEFLKTQRRDAIKTQYCADNGIPLIRIPYWDFDNIDAILTEKLLPLLDASSTQKQAS